MNNDKEDYQFDEADYDMYEEDAHYEIDDKDCTCFDCPDKDICDYAWDLYNTDGDCLAEK
jgi:hypothetical protein